MRPAPRAASVCLAACPSASCAQVLERQARCSAPPAPAASPSLRSGTAERRRTVSLPRMAPARPGSCSRTTAPRPTAGRRPAEAPAAADRSRRSAAIPQCAARQTGSAATPCSTQRVTASQLGARRQRPVRQDQHRGLAPGQAGQITSVQLGIRAPAPGSGNTAARRTASRRWSPSPASSPTEGAAASARPAAPPTRPRADPPAPAG